MSPPPPAATAGRTLPILLGGLALAGIGVAAWLAGRDAAPPAPPPSAAAPNAPVPVVVYVIDTLRADRLGPWGYAGARTPVLDALARESVLFENAYAAAPWTLPSVASLLTSTFPCEHGLVRNQLQLGPELPTLATLLKGLGYATGASYNNYWVGPMAGLDRGYDDSVLRDVLEDDATPAVERFLDQAGSGPVLLYVHTMEPHHPFDTPYEWTKPFGHVPVEQKEAFKQAYFRHRTLKYADVSDGRPNGATDNTPAQDRARERLRELRQVVSTLYDASVSHADANLGRVVGTLKRRGLWDRALVIVLADHGEEFDEHGDWFHDQSVYEELVHVPLLVRFPGGEHGGTRVAARASLVDVLPTVLDFLGRPDLCATCRGTSLLPAVRGAPLPRSIATDAPAVRINGYGYYRPLKERKGDVNVAVRRDGWKAIWNEEPGTTELYALESDPGEQRDRAAADAATAAALRGEAERWLGECRASAREVVEFEGLDPRAREQLKAIGYLD